MNEIIFNRTGHTLLNNGIIGVVKYLEKAKEENCFSYDFVYELSDQQLLIQSESLVQLLEELYYWMGNDVYDTYTAKQLENAEKRIECNVYYDTEKDTFNTFPKISTYGLTHLLTNNAQGITRNEEKWTSVKNLEKLDSDKMRAFKNYFDENNLKMLSKLYFEPYTKITRIIPLKDKHLKKGDKECYLTGELFKELVDIKNVSPFFSGIMNFSSHFSATDKRISWKARYLSMFSPVYAFYHYPNKLRETLYIYMFESDSLLHLKEILDKVELSKTTSILRNEEFLSNIQLSEAFSKEIFTEQYEVAFSLIYSFYKKVIQKYGGVSEDQLPEIDFFKELIKQTPPVTVESFKSDAFSATMRPNTYESINKLSFFVQMFYEFEKKGVKFDKVFSSLRIIRPSEKQAKDKFRLERVLRNDVAQEILTGKSVLSSFEDLFFRSYNYLCASEYVSFKDYKQLLLFLELYELKINTMDEILQSASITLGKQIGVKMRHSDESQNDASNAKKGRGDLITLRKARTKKQFLDELIRIDFKYGLTINEELANKINEQNYYTIKQFLIIGALNVLNPVMHKESKTEKAV